MRGHLRVHTGMQGNLRIDLITMRFRHELPALQLFRGSSFEERRSICQLIAFRYCHTFNSRIITNFQNVYNNPGPSPTTTSFVARHMVNKWEVVSSKRTGGSLIRELCFVWRQGGVSARVCAHVQVCGLGIGAAIQFRDRHDVS